MTMVTKGPRLEGSSCREVKPLLPRQPFLSCTCGSPGGPAPGGPWSQTLSLVAFPLWGPPGLEAGMWEGSEGLCVPPGPQGERAVGVEMASRLYPAPQLRPSDRDSGQGVPKPFCKPFFYEQEARHESMLSGPLLPSLSLSLALFRVPRG